MFYSKPVDLMKEMAEKHIAVEISPSSSDYILGIKGAAHPLRDYVKAGVPVVISTDDAGVARSDLTNEYMRAVLESGLGYEEIKQISLDSLFSGFIQPCRYGRCGDIFTVRKLEFQVLNGRLRDAFVEFERSY
jgi:adenosine deaminase